MQVAVYARVSTDQQARAESISVQIERLLAHAKQQEWDLAPEHLFRDDGYSGSILNRPGLNELRQATRYGAVEKVLITAPDRLARDYVHQVLLLQELEAGGCSVEFLDRPMTQDPHDQLLLHIRGAVAQYERTLIAQRTQQGKERKFNAGLLLPWSEAPYGLRVDPDHPTDPAGVGVDETKAAVVREIFARYRARDGSLCRVARWLADERIPSPKGKIGWRLSTVRKILTNPAYAGLVYRGRRQTCPAKVRWSPVKGIIGKEPSCRAQPRERWKFVAHIPALISEEEFEQVQAKLASNRELAKRNNKAHEYLLRALVSCGECLGACASRTTTTGYAYYLCKNRADMIRKARGQTCRAPYVRADELDALVWDDLCQVLTHPESIRHALERAHGGHWLPQELQERREMVRKSMAGAERQMERLTDAYVAGVIGLEECGRRRRELERQIQVLERQEEQLAQEGQHTLELQGVAASIEAFCRRVETGLASATFDQKRQLVELLIDRVVVTGEEVEIRYVLPTTESSEQIRFCQLRTPFEHREENGCKYSDDSYDD